MVDICWSEARRLAPPASCPYGPIPLDPAAAVLHYAPGDLRGPQGLPSRRRLDRDVPPRGQRRAASSAPPRRLALPELPDELLPRLAQAADRRRPRVGARRRRGRSLYLRPFMFAKEVVPRRAPGQEYLYVPSPRPAGAYFTGGVKPVSIWLSERLRPRGAGRHRRGQVRRQLRRLACSPRRRPPSRAATRWSSSTPSSAATSRSSAA